MTHRELETRKNAYHLDIICRPNIDESKGDLVQLWIRIDFDLSKWTAQLEIRGSVGILLEWIRSTPLTPDFEYSDSSECLTIVLKHVEEIRKWLFWFNKKWALQPKFVSLIREYFHCDDFTDSILEDCVSFRETKVSRYTDKARLQFNSITKDQLSLKPLQKKSSPPFMWLTKIQIPLDKSWAWKIRLIGNRVELRAWYGAHLAVQKSLITAGNQYTWFSKSARVAVMDALIETFLFPDFVLQLVYGK